MKRRKSNKGDSGNGKNKMNGQAVAHKKTASNGHHTGEVKEASTMTKNANGVQSWFASNGMTLVLSIVAFAASFAYLQSTVSNQREKIDDQKIELNNLKADIEKMKTDRTQESQRMVDYMASTQNVLREINGKLDGMNAKK